jgi:hypothetical protein
MEREKVKVKRSSGGYDMSGDRQVVKQLDHMIVRADDPEPLFKLLSETLRLPIAWPLRSYPSFTSGGIPLGIESLKEIVAGVKDFEETQKLWGKLLGANAEAARGSWGIADGPLVHLVSATENMIQSLVLKVSSLKKAETFLSENGMLGALE